VQKNVSEYLIDTAVLCQGPMYHANKVDLVKWILHFSPIDHILFLVLMAYWKKK